MVEKGKKKDDEKGQDGKGKLLQSPKKDKPKGKIPETVVPDDDDEEDEFPPRQVEYNYRKKKGKCDLWHDSTIEYFDKYSNLDVGTEFDTTFRGELVGFMAEDAENYAYIIDLDFYEYQKIGFKQFLGEILHSAIFRYISLKSLRKIRLPLQFLTHSE